MIPLEGACEVGWNMRLGVARSDLQRRLRSERDESARARAKRQRRRELSQENRLEEIDDGIWSAHTGPRVLCPSPENTSRPYGANASGSCAAGLELLRNMTIPTHANHTIILSAKMVAAISVRGGTTETMPATPITRPK